MDKKQSYAAPSAPPLQAANPAPPYPSIHPMTQAPPSYEQALHHPVVSAYADNMASFSQPGYPASTAGYQMPVSHPSAYSMPQQYPYGYGAPPPQPYVPTGAPPGTAVYVRNAYDAGARFDGIAQPNVPPPPPGVAPNVAQMAAMSGQNVALGKKKSSFLTGGTGDGYVFW